MPELLKTRLQEMAPELNKRYHAKLHTKITEKPGMLKPASPGKNKTLKGTNSISKSSKRVSLIRGVLLTDKSPRDLYDWWSAKLDTYGMSANNWHFTWPEIETEYYNQLTHLRNSFDKYPQLDDADGMIEQQALDEYLGLVEEIIKTCDDGVPNPNPNYMLIMHAQIAYIRLVQIRHTGKPECLYTNKAGITTDYLEYFTEIIDRTKDKPIILLPMSIMPKVQDFIKLYGAPIIPFINVFKLVEEGNERLTPCRQIEHDVYFHSDKYINQDLLNLDYTSPESIKTEMRRRMLIINAILSLGKIENPRHKYNTAKFPRTVDLFLVFYDDIHEFYYYISRTKLFEEGITILNPGEQTIPLHWPEQITKLHQIFAEYDLQRINIFGFGKGKGKGNLLGNPTGKDELFKSYISHMEQIIN